MGYRLCVSQLFYFLQINTNGIILLFKNPEKPGNIELNSTKNVFFAPFYGNIDTSDDTTESNGTCYSRAGVTDDKLLDKAEGQIKGAGDTDFSPKYLLIATWDYQNDQVQTTFLLDPVSS